MGLLEVTITAAGLVCKGTQCVDTCVMQMIDIHKNVLPLKRRNHARHHDINATLPEPK